jgi:flavin-binding protein dodecin
MYTLSKESTGGRMGVFWGQSTVSSDAAIESAVLAAKKELPEKTLEWFELIELRGAIENNSTPQYQVAIRVGYV